MTYREALVCGGSFRPLAQRECSIKELEELPLIMMGRGTMTYSFYHQLFLQHGCILEPDTEVATVDQVLPLVRYGLGLGFVPYAMAQAALEREEVFEIRLREEIPRRNVVLVQDIRRPLSIAADAFVKMLN